MSVQLVKIKGVLGAIIGSGSTRLHLAHAGPGAPPSLGSLFAGFTLRMLPVLLFLALFVLLLQAAQSLLALPAVAVAVPQATDSLLVTTAPLLLIGSVDMFSTNTMMAVLENLKRPVTGLLDKFFTTQETSQDEFVHFDIDDGKRYLAPFVHPLSMAPVKDMRGQQTATFEPAYVKEKARWTPNRALRRQVGEAIGGTLSPEQRRQLALASELEDQTERIIRRKEAMAFEALFTGKLVVAGEGYPSQLVNFGRDASLDVAANSLTGTARWDQTNSDPSGDIDDLSEKMDKLSGAFVEHVVLDSAAWKVFRKNKQVQRDLELPRYDPGELQNKEPSKSGLQFKGQFGGVAIWKYTNWYTNNAGVETAMFGGGYALCIGQIDGVQHQGAIMDEDANGYQPYEIFPKSWVTPEPSVRWVMSQSAPLLVPRRINACGVIKVLNES